MSIAENVASVRARIARAATRSGRRPEDVTLVAITKGAGPSQVQEAFAAGVREFGENRLQEAEPKLQALAGIRADTRWHMVGHLQSNKARSALQLFDIIHSVDSVHLGEVLDRRAEREFPVLLEVNVAGEPSKNGFAAGEVAEACWRLTACSKLRVRGLMTIAPAAVDPETVRPVFRRLRELAAGLGLAELSMGMTNDFEVAVEEGATMVRVGTAIFAPRPAEARA